MAELSSDPPIEDQHRVESDLDYLHDQGVVIRAAPNLARLPALGFPADHPDHQQIDLWLPDKLIFDIIPTDDDAAIVRNIAKHIRDKSGVPTVAHAPPSLMSGDSSPVDALHIRLTGIPVADSIPWEDVLQFRGDAETQRHLQAIRIWLQKQSIAKMPANIVLEEIEHLLNEYRRYVAMQNRKHGEGIIQTLFVAGADAVEKAGNLQLGSAVRALVDVRARRLAIEEAEFNAPGREVCFLAHATDFVSRPYGGRAR